MSFYYQQSSKTDTLEACAMAGVEPSKHSTAAVDKEGRGPGTDRISLDALGEMFPPSWSASGSGGIVS